jgi:hypothetical protein
MRLSMRALIVFALAMTVVVHISRVHAAGAMAVGQCGAYGYAFDYERAPEASGAALKKCAGRGCKVVAQIRRACAALSVDMQNACGSHGFATAPKLGQAENTAQQYCYKYGGKDCVIRAWACDARG